MQIDWDKWMKEHGIYIPTAEEAEKAKEEGRIKIKPEKKKR